MGVTSTLAPGSTASDTEYSTCPADAQALAGLFCASDSVSGGATPEPGGVARRGRTAAAAAKPLGSSTAHISPQFVRASGTGTFWVGGSLVEFKAVGGGKRLGGGLRGRCGAFSRACRRRMQRMMGMIRNDAKALLITLTYPRVWDRDARVWAAHLEAFWKRLERKYPKAACVWREEYQQRLAPHFHLMVFNVDFIPYQWVAQAWFEVVGSGDLLHLKAGTEVRRVRSAKGMRSYMKKYMAKLPVTCEASVDDADVSHVGRWWGVKGRDRIPWAECLRVDLSGRELVKGVRFCRRYLRHVAGLRMRSGLRSLSVFADAAKVWGALPQLIC